ncbi:class A beta-lactamase-related serine hydrolase [candidate division KSB1 bacterium]|nr:MAG: class A beta-lactamase-related serine hydrolase [candidate division KSB1 bacterium]MBC6947564.1 class A beta-lactamase-related serine hydrolase [candidate division KSB1 bacterium]MCE7945325.1 class A beta-lactamase-related serine hydrolase [Chlorobi bacterium CHB1]MDL1874427.1 beta-lactamase family protein [Cytophagia bacterium CHB2]
MKLRTTFLSAKAVGTLTPTRRDTKPTPGLSLRFSTALRLCARFFLSNSSAVTYWAILFAFNVATVAQTDTPQNKLPESAAGRRVAAYIESFNSGDEAAVREFQSKNFASTILQRRSEAERLQMYRQIHGNLGRLTLRRVLQAKNDAISILVAAANGEWLRCDFNFEAAAPHKITSLSIDQTEAGDESVSDSPAPNSELELVNDVSAYLDELVQADEFSGVVLLAKNGKPVFQRAYGFASQAYQAFNRVDTKFNLGSINKIFTKIAICQLAEQGRLAFDDPIGKHLPDYPNQQAAEKVTILHLLNMSSGIGDIFNDKYANLPKDRLRTLKDYLPLFAGDPLAFEPGTRRQYSNGGYIVLGAIIEAVSGEDYFDYVRAHIFKPAGMENTGSFEADAIVPNLATGYTLRAGGSGERRSNVYTKPARGSSAGGGYSTAEDLLKFTLALQNLKLLSSEYTKWLLSGMDSAPLAHAQKATVPITEGNLGIAGGAPGINAILDMDVDSGYTLIVLSNYDPPSAEKVGRQIRGRLPRLEN